MTTYCLIGNVGRVVVEIESDQSLAEVGYDHIDGTRIVNVVPKDEMPPGTPQQPSRGLLEPSGCMGYEEGPPMDKILSTGSEPRLDLIHNVGGCEDNEE